VLVGKGEVGFPDEFVEEDDEFAHDGGDGDLEGFALGDEALKEGFEDGVEANGTKGGHVEDASGAGTSASDVTGTAHGAARAL
jgi:hypothetical protein